MKKTYRLLTNLYSMKPGLETDQIMTKRKRDKYIVPVGLEGTLYEYDSEKSTLCAEGCDELGCNGMLDPSIWALVIDDKRSGGDLALTAAGMTYTLSSPTGVPIVGTAELLAGVARVHDATVGSNGQLELNYEGDTIVDWDAQKTMRANDGVCMYVDENDGVWRESDLVLTEVVKEWFTVDWDGPCEGWLIASTDDTMTIQTTRTGDYGDGTFSGPKDIFRSGRLKKTAGGYTTVPALEVGDAV